MYVDKLDGRIDAAFYERMVAEWRTEQDRCLRLIKQHQTVNESYMDEGVKVLELARNARRLFDKQEPREQRRLLDFLVSNCSWKDGRLTATLRQPFDLLAETAMLAANVTAVNGSDSVKTEIWLGGRDSNPDSTVQSRVSYH